MEHTRTWTVDIQLDERDGKTHAKARLHGASDERLVGFGSARLNPADRDVPEIGDELATARALSDLAHLLLDATIADIEGVTREPAQLHL
jgi:hypothetical protein